MFETEPFYIMLIFFSFFLGWVIGRTKYDNTMLICDNCGYKNPTQGSLIKYGEDKK